MRRSRSEPLAAVKHFLPTLLSLAIFAGGSFASEAGTPSAPAAVAETSAAGSAPAVKNDSSAAALDVQAAAPQPHEPEAVAVPETIGVSVLAGVGFLFMFSRRRYA